MRLIKLSFIIISFLWLNASFAATLPLSNCKQLRAPNAVLLVHASWCPHCKSYLPLYKSISNLPEMKRYTFYVKRNDKLAPVCGIPINSVPAVYTHGLGSKLSGEVSRSRLIGFIKS